MTIDPETTDITLFVRTSGEEAVRWDRRRIVEALIREAGIDERTAEAISREVEKQIVSSGISLLTTPSWSSGGWNRPAGFMRASAFLSMMSVSLFSTGTRRMPTFRTPPKGRVWPLSRGSSGNTLSTTSSPGMSATPMSMAICTSTAWATSTGPTAPSSRSSTSSGSASSCPIP